MAAQAAQTQCKIIIRHEPCLAPLQSLYAYAGEGDGDTAYIVVRVAYTYREHGKPIVEPAQMAAALRKETDGWKIASWAWAGEAPRRVKR